MTEIVGILNITPDSFSDGGEFNDTNEAVKRVERLFLEGADKVDIGAESTRPGASALTAKQEWQRLKPVIALLKREFSASKISIDTRHGETVERVVDLWSPDITVNDVTGLRSEKMIDVVANNGLKVIVGHLPRSADGDISMTHNTKLNDINQVRDDLVTKYIQLVSKGIAWENITIDPGIGFGKTRALNRQLLQFPQIIPSIPVMIGYSRKRFLGARRMQESTNIQAGKIAVKSGASYLRVHDVGAHVQMLKDLSI